MSLFRFNWLRNLIKRNMNPIAEDRATLWKRRLSITYAIVAWNAFGYVLYMMVTGKADWGKYHGLRTEDELHLTPAQQWAKTLNIKDATVYRVSSFNVKKYEIHDDNDDDKNEQTNAKNVEEK